MAKETLTVALIGADEDQGDPRLGDFAKFCASLTQCLRIIEEIETEQSGKVGYRIVDLHHSNATLTIAPVPHKKAPATNGRIFGTFRETIRTLQEGGQVDPRLTLDHLKQFRTLMEGKYRKGVLVEDMEVTTQYIANIDAILGKAIDSVGSVSGRLERIDAHETKEATLFTPTGEAVRCIFDDEGWPTAKAAFERHVTLYGRMTYRVDAAYPSRVYVEDIEVHPPDDELPTADDLRGLFGPEATGGMSADEFVRALRNDEG